MANADRIVILPLAVEINSSICSPHDSRAVSLPSYVGSLEGRARWVDQDAHTMVKTCAVLALVDLTTFHYDSNGASASFTIRIELADIVLLIVQIRTPA